MTNNDTIEKVMAYLSAPCDMSLTTLSRLAGALNNTVSVNFGEITMAREFSEYTRDEYIVRCANRYMDRSLIDHRSAVSMAAACYDNQVQSKGREFNSPEKDADVEMAHWDDFAFDYTEFGVGKSLLEDNKILASIRTVLMFSNTMAAIKNSTTKNQS